MKITCPDCSTSYEVSDAALGPSGRSVKCARCGTRWHAGGVQDAIDTVSIETDLPADTTSTAGVDDTKTGHAEPVADVDWDAAETEESFPASFDEAGARPEADDDPFGIVGETDADDAGFDDPLQDLDIAALTEEANSNGPAEDPPQPIDIETLAKKPKIHVRMKQKEPILRRMARALWRRTRQIHPRRVVGGLVFLSAIGACMLVVSLRNPIVERMPDLAGLFAMAGLEVNLRGLEFRDLRTFRELENGTVVLVIEGTIENIKARRMPVPAMRFALRSDDAQEIYAWVVEPRLRRLEPGGSTRFRTRLSAPPALAADIQVRFVEREQQQAQL